LNSDIPSEADDNEIMLRIQEQQLLASNILGTVRIPPLLKLFDEYHCKTVKSDDHSPRLIYEGWFPITDRFDYQLDTKIKLIALLEW
jgi:hypothetical protein